MDLNRNKTMDIKRYRNLIKLILQRQILEERNRNDARDREIWADQTRLWSIPIVL